MADGVLLREGPRAYWVEAGRPPVGAPWSSGPLPENLRALLPRPGRGAVGCVDPSLVASATALGVAVHPAGVAELRRAREALPLPVAAEERAWILTRARADLEKALAAPVETLIALAREEERVERTVGRETGAKEQFLPGPTGELAEYARDHDRFLLSQREHHERLAARLERLARATLPNLSVLVGPRIAARLLAAAGGFEALARSTGARLQILGARRRPSGHGPRFGLLYRAARMADVPPDRRGRYARSLAALAVIAARADAYTHADVAAALVARRDRRVEQLRRQG